MATYFTHIDDVTPEKMDAGDGWLITEFRLPFSERQGRLIDFDEDGSMERKKRDGYF